VDQLFAYLYTLREADEKIVRCQLFPTVQAAMDSAKASKPLRATAGGLSLQRRPGQGLSSRNSRHPVW
jgi:hypothetical protein